MGLRNWSKVTNYFSFVKIQHTIFSLPFALIGFFLAVTTAKQEVSFRLFLLVVLCVFFARNAAMGFNRFADREFDNLNPRTALREIPRNIIRPKSALMFVLINCILFMLATSFLNILCLLLSPVALLVVLGYSFTKRFTSFSQLILGLGLSLAPIGAYLAVYPHFDLLPLLFSFSVLFWVAGFDIIYALQDIDFDKSVNLRSLPVRMGKRNALILSSIFHLVSVLLLVAAGLSGPFSWVYWTGLGLFTLLVIYQHLLVKPEDLSRVNLAFFTLNGIASVIYACFVVADLYLT